ncbi:hypothetical protein FW774_02680 (plasmid) [Pedobacter sp. BS3]|uniref:hypothetical protein n=1 Tax=Pedobacter sp. BS3 TaxID=2567937 RepID=UPI0011EBD716|nr:hypothetical protein [Pedobacter sp. BS3]TZF85986.1 hypothetical protein FW774_02680 [Pedobacter sp. BS3]
MIHALVRLSYKQIIDNNTPGNFAQRIFHDSYNEFLLKVQEYNPDNGFDTFKEIISANIKANSLHYKTQFAILHHIELLSHQIPYLPHLAGIDYLPFDDCQMHIINSSITDKTLHKISLTYTTGEFLLVQHFGEYLILAIPEQQGGNSWSTFTLKMQGNLSVCSYTYPEA